jgi:hypothetical protein
MVVVLESSLLYSLILWVMATGFVNRCGQTPRRGDRLIGLATAAKEECAQESGERKQFAAEHG